MAVRMVVICSIAITLAGLVSLNVGMESVLDNIRDVVHGDTSVVKTEVIGRVAIVTTVQSSYATQTPVSTWHTGVMESRTAMMDLTNQIAIMEVARKDSQPARTFPLALQHGVQQARQSHSQSKCSASRS